MFAVTFPIITSDSFVGGQQIMIINNITELKKTSRAIQQNLS